jgi:hypothetical protein
VLSSFHGRLVGSVKSRADRVEGRVEMMDRISEKPTPAKESASRLAQEEMKRVREGERGIQCVEMERWRSLVGREGRI